MFFTDDLQGLGEDRSNLRNNRLRVYLVRSFSRVLETTRATKMDTFPQTPTNQVVLKRLSVGSQTQLFRLEGGRNIIIPI